MSLADDIQRAFTLIRQLQGALAGGAIRWGQETLTWPGGSQFSNFPSITHGLNKEPRVVWAFPIGSLSAGAPAPWALCTAFSYDDTEFILQARSSDESSPAAATTSLVGWVALG